MMIKLRQLINEDIIDDIVKSGYFKIEMGSGTTGHQNPKSKDVKKYFETLIRHEFMDRDFYHNYTDNGEEYLKSVNSEIVEPFMKNLKGFIKKYMDVSKDGVYSMKRNFDKEKFVINHIKNSKKISKETKSDYYEYQLDYVGKKVW
jgi:hypothetical protein